jgi:hypothetical protein
MWHMQLYMETGSIHIYKVCTKYLNVIQTTNMATIRNFDVRSAFSANLLVNIMHIDCSRNNRATNL